MKTVTLANVTSPKIIDKNTIEGTLNGHKIQIHRRPKAWNVILDISINGRLWHSDVVVTPSLIKEWDKLDDLAWIASEKAQDAARALINDREVNAALFLND